MKPTSAQTKKIYQTLNFQYEGINFRFTDINIIISRKTKRIKIIKNGDIQLFSLRTNDGRLLPTMDGGRYLLENGYKKNRVVVNNDAAPFVSKGKSAFCKHVIKVDDNIVPEIEVLLMSENNRLLAIGTAVQPGYAMLQLDTGIAVKSKHH